MKNFVLRLILIFGQGPKNFVIIISGANFFSAAHSSRPLCSVIGEDDGKNLFLLATMTGKMNQINVSKGNFFQKIHSQLALYIVLSANITHKKFS